MMVSLLAQMVLQRMEDWASTRSDSLPRRSTSSRIESL